MEKNQSEHHLREVLATAYRGFDDVIGADFTPFDVCRVTLSKNGDRLPVDVEFAVLSMDIAFKAAVDRVVFEHVDLP